MDCGSLLPLSEGQLAGCRTFKKSSNLPPLPRWRKPHGFLCSEGPVEEGNERVHKRRGVKISFTGAMTKVLTSSFGLGDVE
jgi:hypothetical protein